MFLRTSAQGLCIIKAKIRKAGRLGNDRPSLGARLGVGLSKPLGVWEGGFDERPGEPPAGYGKLGFERLGERYPLRPFRNA